jgi:hypothetical protein
VSTQDATLACMVVVEHWFEELKARAVTCWVAT